MSKSFANLVLLFLLPFSLTACTMFSPVKNQSSTTYVISSVPKVPTRRTSGYTLLVTSPFSNSIYNTPQIAYTTRPYEVDYFIKSRWADTPAQMLHPLLVEALQNTHYFAAVGTGALVSRYDFLLQSQLIELKQDYSHVPHTLRLTLRVELSNIPSNRVLGTQVFSDTEIIYPDSPYGGVLAANRATASVLRQVAQFCMRKI